MPRSADAVTHESGEISLADVVEFMVSWWKLIVACGAVAVLAAWFHLSNVPVYFRAQTIIAMAQVPKVSNSELKSVSVESPALLAERMSLPTTFPASTVRECGFGSSAELMRRLTIISHNNANSTLRFAVQHASPNLAKQCVRAVFDMIREQQAVLAKPVAARMEQALNGIGRLLPDGQVKAVRKTGASPEHPGLLEQSSESIWINLAIQELKQTVMADTGTRMLTPVYAQEEPLSSGRKQTLMSWGTLGVLLGFVVALIWTLVAQFRRESL